MSSCVAVHVSKVVACFLNRADAGIGMVLFHAVGGSLSEHDFLAQYER